VAIGLAVLTAIVIVAAAVASSLGAAVWTNRRVRAQYGEGITIVATSLSALVTFGGGWLVFGPAWFGGAARRWFSSTPRARRSGRFVLRSLALGGVATTALGMTTTVTGLRDAHREHHLRARGVVAEGRALSVHYDEGGGDPGGWTSINVEFTDGISTRRVVTVGHHFDARETKGDVVAVLYDPLHPTVATYAAIPFDDSTGGGSWFSVALAAAGAIIAAGLLVGSRHSTTVGPRSQSTLGASESPWPPPDNAAR
jgi:hypothetical protein